MSTLNLFLKQVILAALVFCTASLTTLAHEKRTCLSLLMSEVISSARRSWWRGHPDQVDPYSLKVGDTVVLAPEAFKSLSSIKGEITEAIEMRVVDVRETAKLKKKRAWRAHGTVVFLESPVTGRVALTGWDLSGNTYSTKDYLKHAPYKPNEYVQIGSDFDTKIVTHRADAPNDTITFEGSAVPYIAKFIDVADPNNLIVEVRSKSDGLAGLRVKIAKDKVSGFVSGSEETTKTALKKFLDLHLSFQLGEPVRFRGRDGLMREGTFLNAKKNVSEIQSTSGEIISVSESRTFKKPGDLPAQTPMYNADWIQAEFKSPTGVVADFLDGAAKISSHPDFMNLKAAARIKILMQYTQRNMPWTKAAIKAENAGLSTFEELICAGVGVCRHNSTLLATVLSEAGFSTRLVKYTPPVGDGHAWFEVDMSTSGGSMQTYVVDPSNGTFIEPLWKVKQMIKEKPDSFPAKWYLQPERDYLLPTDY